MAPGMVVTDLDGTLLTSGRCLGEADRRSLEALGRAGIVRVVATGRSLFSARRVLGADFPIDFLVHTSGAGIMHWPEQRSLRVLHMEPQLAAVLAARLVELEVDFMLHRAIPDNHRFFLHRSSHDNDDFERRVQLYAEFASELELGRIGTELMCQAVVIEPASSPSRWAELLPRLPEFRVIRATSPLDHRSTWIEVFPSGVGKATAAAWLHERALGGRGRCVAIGNDYNDIDLLDWADLPYVVANAPAELLGRYRSVASNDAGGFSDAVERALRGDA